VNASRACLDHPLHELERVQRPAEAGFRVGDDRGEPVRVALALGPFDLIRSAQSVVQPSDHGGCAVRRVKTLVGVDLAREVSVRSDLPSGEVDRLETGLDHLYGLSARESPERAHVILPGQELPEAFGTEPRQRVLDENRAANPNHVRRLVRPLDAAPAVSAPLARERVDLSVQLQSSPSSSAAFVSWRSVSVVITLAPSRAVALRELGCGERLHRPGRRSRTQGMGDLERGCRSGRHRGLRNVPCQASFVKSFA
jgi:hypothetical protein